DDRNLSIAFAPKRCEVSPRRSIRFLENHVGASKLLVRRHEPSSVDESRTPEAIQVRSDDQRGEPLAEAGDDVEGSRRAVANQTDAVQRIVQLFQLFIDLFEGSAFI